MEKPKWLETLTNHSPPLFQSTNKLQRIFQSCVEVKREREGDGGKEKLTFNLSFSCYVHLHSHGVQPPLWFHKRLVWSLQRCMTNCMNHGNKAGHMWGQKKKSFIMSSPLGKPYFHPVFKELHNINERWSAHRDGWCGLSTVLLPSDELMWAFTLKTQYQLWAVIRSAVM